MKNLSLVASFIAATLALGATSAASAATTSTTLAASTTVAAKCYSLTATAIAFDAYEPDAAAASTKSTTITAYCTKGTPLTVSLDKGANGASTSARKLLLSGGSDELSYQLYSDVNAATVWDDNDGKVSGTGNGLNQLSYTVYGKIPAKQDVSPGSYADSVQVTVTY